MPIVVQQLADRGKEALLTDTGALDRAVRPARRDPQPGPDVLLEDLWRPHHVSPLGRADGPVPQVSQTGQVGAGLGQGGH